MYTYVDILKKWVKVKGRPRNVNDNDNDEDDDGDEFIPIDAHLKPNIRTIIQKVFEFQVAWIKSDTKAILAIHNHMVAQNQRITVTHNGHNTWKLHVSNVQKNDSGTYMCQINTDPMRSQVCTV